VVEGELQQAVPAVDVELPADVVAVIFDGFRADFQQFGNLLADAVFGDEFQDALGGGLFSGLH
jgi:hypothetical protein